MDSNSDSDSSSVSSLEFSALNLSPIYPYVKISRELQDLRKDVFKLYRDVNLITEIKDNNSHYDVKSVIEEQPENHSKSNQTNDMVKKMLFYFFFNSLKDYIIIL
jgi:hypothetical protein